MKKYLLKLSIVSCLFFLGFNNAHAAQTITVVNNTTSTAANPLTSQLYAVVDEITVTSTGNTTARPNTMTFTASTNPSLETGNITLYTYTSATFPGTANATPLATITGPGTTMVFNFTALSLPQGTIQYFFLVENFSRPTTAGAIRFSWTNADNNAGNLNVPGAAVAGTAYTWVAATAVTFTTYKTPGSNGLPANPIYTTQATPAIYGFSLQGSAAGTATAINEITFTDGGTTGGANSNFFTNIALYSSTTSTFPGAGNAGATLIQSVPADGTTAATFTGLNLVVSPSPAAATYYFIVVTPSFQVSAVSDYQLNYTSNSGTFITAAAANKGYDYTITPPTYTIATNTTGISTGPYYYGVNGNVLESFGVSTAAGSGTFTDFTLTSTVAYTLYFSNLTLYSSSNPNYAADLAGTGSPLTAVTFTTTGTTNLTVTLSNPQGIGVTPIYYFLVADFTAGDNLLPATFQFNFSAADANSGGTPMVATNTFPINYTNYNLKSPIVFGGPYTTGLATVNQLNYDQAQVGILGFSITTPIAQTITQINFAANIVPASNEINAFFSNLNIYYNTTNTAVGATLITGATVSSLNGKTFNISGLNQVINNTTVYYFIEADFTAPTNFSSTFQLTATSATNSTSLVCNDNAPISGTVYNISPSVTLGSATATGLAANPITSSQNGATLAVFGFSVFTGPTNTFTQFNLYSTQPVGQYLGTNFSGYALYVNTTANSLTGATLVTGATFSAIAASNTLTISTLNQAIPAGKTYYYFIKAVFASPSVATTYQLNLLSVVNNASKTFTTGGPINGINYTLSGPLGVYYWEASVNRFGIVTSNIWENANNWLNANTGTTGNGYPGQTLTNDVAVFSGTYIKYNLVVVNASETVSQMLVNIDDTYSMIVNISNGTTFKVTNTFTLGDPGLTDPQPPPANPANIVRSQLILGEVSTNGTGQYVLSGLASIYNDGSLALQGPTTFSSGSTLNLYGTTNDPAFFGIYSCTVTAPNVTWNLTGNSSGIFIDNTTTSILKATNSTVNFTGFSTQISSFGYPTFTGCTFNSSTISNNTYLSGIATSAGVTSITNSVINMGTASNNGNYNGIQNTGGTVTIDGASVVNLKGPSSFLYNDYTATNIGTNRNPVYTPQAYFNINAATVNMGTAGGSDGSSAYIYNTDAAFFNLNAGSVVNMNGANTEIYNTSDANYSGTTGYGVFQAASTSIINPISTTALVYNTNASNYFTLLSDISGAATIGKLGTGAKLSGQYNVQRYLNGGATYLRNYRLLSSPINVNSAVSNATNLIDLTYLGATATIPNTATTYYGAFIGGPGSGFGSSIHTFTNPLMYLYQENVVPGANYKRAFTSGKNVGIMSLNSTNHTLGTSNTADGYGSGSGATAPSVASTSISKPGYDSSTGVPVLPGNGYIMYYVGNSQNASPATVTAPSSSTITASGYINQSQVQLFMWGSDSPNLTDTYGIPGVRLPGITVVGNPYPSTLDLYQVWFDNSHAITPSLYQLDKTNQQFDTYNASTNISSTGTIGGVSSSRYVASGQGFYIHVDSLGNTHQFYFQEDQKANSATAPVFPPISNFGVISPPGLTTDNLNNAPANDVAVGRPSVDNVNINPDASVKAIQGNTFGSGPNSATMLALARVNAMNNANAAVPDTTIKSIPPFTFVRAVRHLPKPGVPLNFGVSKEAKQPKQSTPVTMQNVTALHLKFVVDSTDYDEVAVCFNKAWSDKFDRDDSFDLDGQSGKVYLSSYTSDNVRTSINMLGDYTPGKRVKLYVKAAADGIFQLQMTDIANFNKNQYSVFLIDNLKKDSLDLTLYKSYNFNFTASDTAQFRNRFVLAIEHKPIAHYQLLTFAGSKVVAGVQLDWKTINEKNYTQFELQKLVNNTYVSLAKLQSDSLSSYGYVDQHPTLGNNTYRLQQTDGLGNITYSAPVTIGYNTTANSGLTVYPNPAKSNMTVTLTNGSTAVVVATADIYNTSGKLITHKVVNSNSFTHDVSGYDLGAYVIELKDKNGTLVGKSKFVKVQ